MRIIAQDNPRLIWTKLDLLVGVINKSSKNGNEDGF